MKRLTLLLYLFVFFSCKKDEDPIPNLQVLKATAGDNELMLDGSTSENIPIDRPISLTFSQPIDRTSAEREIQLLLNGNPVNISFSFISQNHLVNINSIGGLQKGKIYQLKISNQLKSENGATYSGSEINFKTVLGNLEIQEIKFENAETTRTGRLQNVATDLKIEIHFNEAVDRESLAEACHISGPSSPSLQFSFSDEDKEVSIRSNAKLTYLSKYLFRLDNKLFGKQGESFEGIEQEFYTEVDEAPKFPIITDGELLTLIQEKTFGYFWEHAHPTSGMALERNNSGNTVTTGGSGFGVMSLIVGVERGFITRQQALERWSKIIDFLSTADRFHGVWPHWLNGNTGKTIPFSSKDNGGDLVETAFMIQGLLTLRNYLDSNITEENVLIQKINQLWREVEWDWYTKDGSNVLFWHWSPNYQWEINLPIRGYNESLIVYILAAASPTHPIERAVYENGWARNGNMVNGKTFYGIQLPLGEDLGGPLFFSHYSFLGLDPRNLSDQYANYWEQGVNHSKINQAYCEENPLGYIYYSDEAWGLTASDNHNGYSAHSPTNDLGVITPTAAISSLPYTPEASLKAIRHFYYTLGDKTWGEYGFYDAFNITENWYASSYLAIDQGPIILMIENYRTGLLWEHFMSDQEVHDGLDKLGFTYQ